jgi:hypothetical protein
METNNHHKDELQKVLIIEHATRIIHLKKSNDYLLKEVEKCKKKEQDNEIVEYLSVIKENNDILSCMHNKIIEMF